MTARNIQELIGLMQKNMECSICLELLTNPVSTKCDHCFCSFCITQFLENKRSVPCPLCKQPVTKRSLHKIKELGNIVNAVRKLTVAFQDDSGTIYSPPKGPQSFFPCSPDTVISKPNAPKSKPRRNLRSTKQASVTTDADSNLGLLTDDHDSDETSVTSRTASRRKSAPSAQSAPNTSRTSLSRSRSRTRSASATTTQVTEGLLQYLDEGSCGYVGGGSPCDSSPSEQPPKPKAQSESSDKSKGVTIFVEDDVEDSVLEREQQEKDNQRKSMPSVEETNRRNTRSSKQVDKEDISVNTRSLRTKKEGTPKSGLTEGSQNSSDMSISSTQQFLQPRPIITRTYDRHPNTRGSSDWKVQTWIASFSVNQHDPLSKIEDDERVERGNCKRNEENVPKAPAKQNGSVVNELQRQNENSPVIDFVNDDNKITEKMLTPPVRKKPIFKRKEPLEEQAQSKTEDESEDPYLFVAGHTPVAKCQKQGRPRSKKNKRKNVPKPALRLSLAEKKPVTFSDADVQSLKNPTSSAVTENVQKEKEADVTNEEFDFSAVDAYPQIIAEPGDTDTTHTVAALDTSVEQTGKKGKQSARKKRQTGQDRSSKVSHEEEIQNEREKQMEELAAWINQAEDHNLVFSTQDANANIDSMEMGDEGTDRNESSSINVDDYGDDDDDKDACLIRRSAPEQGIVESCNELEVAESEQGNEITNQEDKSAKKSLREDAMETEVCTAADTGSCCSPEHFKSPPPPEVPPSKSGKADDVAEMQLSSQGFPHDIVLPSPAVTTRFPTLSTPKQRITQQTRSAVREQSSNKNTRSSTLAHGSLQTEGRAPLHQDNQQLVEEKNGKNSCVSASCIPDTASPASEPIAGKSSHQRKLLSRRKSAMAESKNLSESEGSSESANPIPAADTETASSRHGGKRDQGEKGKGENGEYNQEEEKKLNPGEASVVPDTLSAAPADDVDACTAEKPVPSLDITGPTLEDGEAINEPDSGSSATDDVNVTPALGEFEPADLALQPEDIAECLSSPSLSLKSAGASTSHRSPKSASPKIMSKRDGASGTGKQKSDLSVSKAKNEIGGGEHREKTRGDSDDDDIRIIEEEDTSGFGDKHPQKELGSASLETMAESTLTEDSSTTQAPESVDVVEASENAESPAMCLVSRRRKKQKKLALATGCKLTMPSPPTAQQISSQKLLSPFSDHSQSLSHSSSVNGSPSQSLLHPFPAKEKVSSKQTHKSKQKSSNVDGKQGTGKSPQANAESETEKATVKTESSSVNDTNVDEKKSEKSASVVNSSDASLEPESLPLVREYHQELDMEGGFIHDENADAKESTDHGMDIGTKMLVADTQYPTPKSSSSPPVPSSGQVVVDSVQDMSDGSPGQSHQERTVERGEPEKETALDATDSTSMVRKQESSRVEEKTETDSSKSSAPKIDISKHGSEIARPEKALNASISSASLGEKSHNAQKLATSSPQSLQKRKRKSGEIEDMDNAHLVRKSPRLHPSQTPQQKNLIPPASSSGKTICSAPPPLTSIASDSDDEDAVLVRRTKRKCFSLDGSPLRSRTPAKRLRSRLQTRVVNDDVGEEEDSGSKNDVKQVAEENCGAGGEHGSQVAKVDGAHEMELEGENEDAAKRSQQKSVVQDDTQDPDSGQDTAQNSQQFTTRENRNKSQGEVQVIETPSRKARKTRRGLASNIGNDILLSSSADTQNSLDLNASLCVSSDADKQSKESVDVDMTCEETGKGQEKDTEGRREEEKETKDPETSGNDHTSLNKLQTPAAATAAAEVKDGADVGSMLPSQHKPTSVSQDKSREIAHASLRTEVDDATLPPSGFDLRFDDEDDQVVDEQNEDAGDEERAVIISGDTGEPVQEGRASPLHLSSPLMQMSPALSHDKGDKVNIKTAAAEVVEDNSDEEVAVKKKKPKQQVIDSDTESSHDSSDESEASFQLNFTSSSAMSSQSEILTTQQRTSMEAELVRMRTEIAEMEAKLLQHSSKSDSGGDSSNSDRKSKNRQKTSNVADTDAQTLSPICVATTDSFSAVTKALKRKVLHSMDESDSGEENNQKVVKENAGNKEEEEEMNTEVQQDGAGSLPDEQVPLLSSPICTPIKQKDGTASDEDSDDLFLSPLSPTPPPARKQTLARRLWGPAPFPIDVDDIIRKVTRPNSPVTKVRQALEFMGDDSKSETAQSLLKKYDDLEDSQDSVILPLSSMKRVPESQMSDDSDDASSSANSKSKRRLQRQSRKSRTQETGSGTPASVCVVESSGSPGPSVPKSLRLSKPLEDYEEDVIDDGDDDKAPRWKKKKMGFIISGLDPDKANQLRQLAGTNDCKVYSKFNDHITHVIIKTCPVSRVCERTLKYFQGIAGRCWVLSYDWVTDSMEAGQPLPEADYEIAGDSVKGDDHNGPRAARLSSSPLLAGFAFTCIGVSPDMSKKEVMQLLTMCGAEVLEDPWDLNGHSAKYKLVIRCVDSDAQPPTPAEIELFNGQYKHFGLVTVAREWILDSICTYTLQSLADYVFNTNKDLCLPL